MPDTKNIPIRWGKYIDHNMEKRDVMFIGAEKAIYGANGRRLDEKLVDMEGSLSDAFSETKDYAVGEYCVYTNRVFKFTKAKTAGEWDGTAVIPVSLAQEISEVSRGIAALNSHFVYAKNLNDLISKASNLRVGVTCTLFLESQCVYELTNTSNPTVGKGFVSKITNDLFDLTISAGGGYEFLSGRFDINTNYFRFETYAKKSDLPQFETSDVTSTVATVGVGCVARKYGKIVFLNVHLTFTSNVAQYEQIASTPYPTHLGKGDSYAGFAQFGSTSNVRRIYVAGTKLFTGSALTKGESLVGSIAYITV